MRRLWFLAVLLLVGYAVLPWWFPLVEHYDRLPLADIRTFAPALTQGLLYALLVCALFAVYWLAYHWVQRSSQPPPGWSILLATALFGLPLILTYPINAVDVFRYFYEGRMMVEFGANPLTTPPNAFSTDPYQPFAAILFQKTSPYGPLWELFGGLVYLSSRDNLLTGLLLFKVAGLAFHLAAGVVIWHLLASHDPRTRTAQLLLWLWNPILLFMFVVDAHNDILMLLCLLLGYWSMRQGHSALGLTIMALSPLVKPIGLLPIPLFAVAAWQQAESHSQRIRLLIFATLGIALVTILAFLPFGSPMPLLRRLIDESQSGAIFSPGAYLYWLGEANDRPVSLPLLGRGASLILGVYALLLFWLALRGRPVVRGAADIFTVYLFTALRFRIWYTTWPFPWLVLDPQSPARLYTGLSLLLLSHLSVIHYGHIRVAWLGDNMLLAHFIAIPIIFGLSLLIGLIASWFARHRDKAHAGT
jgi:hypothetical protein